LTAPVPAGLYAVISVLLTTVMPVAGFGPKSTTVGLFGAKPVPVIVTNVPPTGKPMFGLMPWTDGGAVELRKYRNRSAEVVAEVPPGVVTVTFTAPGFITNGLITTIWLAVSLMRPVTAAIPKATAVAFARFVPVMVTMVPPEIGPDAGLTLVTAGTPRYVNWAPGELGEVPVGVVTVT
jgi:hypothetical protein